MFLKNESGLVFGAPVGALIVTNERTKTNRQFPVYMLKQRLGLFTTEAKLTNTGLRPTKPNLTILDMAQEHRNTVQVRLFLFQEDILSYDEQKFFPLGDHYKDESFQTSGEVAAQPIESNQPDAWWEAFAAAVTNPRNQPAQYYEDQIEVFSLLDQLQGPWPN